MKVCVLNCENLFRLDVPGTQENKTDEQCRALATSMLRTGADIFLLSEIGGPESLHNFCRDFLHDQFQPHIIAGNSERGIDVGALTNRDLKLDFEYHSNKQEPLNFTYRHERKAKSMGQPAPETHFFSRDVGELRCTGNGKTIATFLNVHLKSQLDTHGIDPRGFERRQAEVETLLRIHKRRSEELCGPVFVSGDFNGNASRRNTSGEFASIYDNSELEDALEIVGTEHRWTYHFASRGFVERGTQLDYFFVPRDYAHLVKNAEIAKYHNAHGQPTVERHLSPSDHLPLVIELQLDI